MNSNDDFMRNYIVRDELKVDENNIIDRLLQNGYKPDNFHIILKYAPRELTLFEWAYIAQDVNSFIKDEKIKTKLNNSIEQFSHKDYQTLVKLGEYEENINVQLRDYDIDLTPSNSYQVAKNFRKAYVNDDNLTITPEKYEYLLNLEQQWNQALKGFMPLNAQTHIKRLGTEMLTKFPHG